MAKMDVDLDAAVNSSEVKEDTETTQPEEHKTQGDLNDYQTTSENKQDIAINDSSVTYKNNSALPKNTSTLGAEPDDVEDGSHSQQFEEGAENQSRQHNNQNLKARLGEKFGSAEEAKVSANGAD